MFELHIEYPIIWEWLSFALRWLHVITAIAWVGSSFYFIALDLGLRQRDGLPEGAYGEEWQVHGGGFYHVQKYLVAPKHMPEHLTWFKWESYATALSGIALLMVIYYAGAELLLIDPSVMDLSPIEAILLSACSLIIGYIVYDLLCKSPLGKNINGLMIALFGYLLLVSFLYHQVFSGRAAMLHVGMFTGLIMSANVFMIIMPNQRKVVAALLAGDKPDPALGVQAKQRSLHNNYLSLPVLFLMLSNHYPLAFASQYGWLIAGIIFLTGVCIRHFFNTMHGRKGKPYWVLILAALLFSMVVFISSLGVAQAAEKEEPVHGFKGELQASPLFEAVTDIVMGRCSMCHAKEPFWDGMVVPPRGVILEEEAMILSYAKTIYLQAGRTNAMPPANISYMEAEERQLIREWYESAF